jgi:hypothetical protein
MRPALVALVALLVAAPAAQARIEAALQDDAVFLDHSGPVSLPDAYAAARRLGVTRLRINVGWARAVGAHASDPLRPPRIAYDFSAWDRAIAEARAHGLRVQLTLTTPAPAFATADRRVGVDAPDAGAFADFARAAAEHFRGRVERYSLWNEPNWHSNLRPVAREPAIYRSLYRGGARAIRAADPRARILIGELASYGPPDRATAPLRFLRELLCGPRRRLGRGCARLKTDGLAMHPYWMRGPPTDPGPTSQDVTVASLPRLDALLRRLARARLLRTARGRPLPVYITEYGYPAHGRAVPSWLQASYLVDGWDIASRDRSVREITQYQLVPSPAGSAWDSSLLFADGTPSAAFEALRGWIAAARRHGVVGR